MNKIKLLLFTLFTLLISEIIFSQKAAIIKNVSKHVAKEVISESSETITKRGAKKISKNFTEEIIAEQAVKKIARDKLYTFIKDNGFNSLIEYANSNASKKLMKNTTSAVGKKYINKHNRYKQNLLNLRKNQDYVKRTWTRLHVTSKDQYITSKNYLSAISMNQPNFKIGYPKDGPKLRDNMLQVMPEKAKKIITNPNNKNQAHHIIGKATPKATSTLQKYEIDINDPMNGIFLPVNGDSGLKGTVHYGGHKQDYYDYVENLFSNCKSKQDCYDVLDKIKSDFYNGKIELYNTHQANGVFTNKKAA